MSNKNTSEVDLKVLDKTPTTTQNTMDLVPTTPIFGMHVSYHNGKVIIQPNQFMYLGESFESF